MQAIPCCPTYFTCFWSCRLSTSALTHLLSRRRGFCLNPRTSLTPAHGPTRPLFRVFTGPAGPVGPNGPNPSDAEAARHLPAQAHACYGPSCSVSDTSSHRAPGSASRHRPGSGLQPCSRLTAPRTRTLHPSRFRLGPCNLAHPPCDWAAKLGAPPAAPARIPRSSKQHLRRIHQQGMAVTIPLPSISWPTSLTRMRTQMPIVIVPAGDLRLRAIGRSQGIGVRRQRHLAALGAAGRELHTTAPAVCILERHSATAILPSYWRTRWVRLPRQRSAPPHVHGCRASTHQTQVTEHARGSKLVTTIV